MIQQHHSLHPQQYLQQNQQPVLLKPQRVALPLIKKNDHQQQFLTKSNIDIISQLNTKYTPCSIPTKRNNEAFFSDGGAGCDDKPMTIFEATSEQNLNDNDTNDEVDDTYIKIYPIGHGSTCQVFFGMHKKLNLPVAIKVMEKSALNNNISAANGTGATEINANNFHRTQSKNQIEFSKTMKEIDIMKQICHPNIISFYDVIESENQISIIMEMADNGCLGNFIHQGSPMSEELSNKYMKQICEAIKYLHNEKKILHRDVKAENILLDSNFNIKLIDFGFSKELSQIIQTRCGSPCYAAPEVILGGKNYNAKADIWSLGVLLYYMLTSTFPFFNTNIQKLMQIIVDSSIEFRMPTNISDECKDLLSHMLAKDPDQRFTIDEVCTHPWFVMISKCRSASLPTLNLPNPQKYRLEIFGEMEKLGYTNCEELFEQNDRRFLVAYKIMENHLASLKEKGKKVRTTPYINSKSSNAGSVKKNEPIKIKNIKKIQSIRTIMKYDSLRAVGKLATFK